jgi:O-antigen/teichoic acid export membrane protein
MNGMRRGVSAAGDYLPSWTRLWARDSGLLLLSQGLTVVATTLAAILIARNLEPADWGVFSALLGLGFALAVFVEFGLGTWLLRELSALFADLGDAAEQRAKHLAGAAITCALAVAAVIVALGTTISLVRGEGAGFTVALSTLLFYAGVFASGTVLEAYLRSRRRLRRVVSANILEKWVLVLLLVAVVATGAEVWEIGVAYAIAGLTRFTILGASVFGRRRPPAPTLREALGLWRRSFPFALTSAALTVVPKFDTLLLLALSATAAGYYALGDRMLGPAGVVPVIGATALYPFLARRTHRPGAIWGLAGVFLLGGAAVAVAGFAIAPQLVTVVFGEQYEAAVPAVRWMILALPLIYASQPLLVYGFSAGRERAVVLATMTASLAGTVAILAGYGLGGATGAAGGFFIRQGLILLAFVAIAVRPTSRDTVPDQLPVSARTEAQVG